jgi:glucosamine kinase
VKRIVAAVGAALAGCDPGTVAGCVAGLAGAGQHAADAAVAEAFRDAWRAAGLTCPVRVASDVAVAFAAGTPHPTGSVLLAGTGAVAARIREHEPVAMHGGYGWLLGDGGSGFYIGRRAVHSTLSTLDSGAPVSPLHRLVLDHYSVDQGQARDIPDMPMARLPLINGGWGSALHAPDRMAALIREVNRHPPVALAELAPLVMRAYAAGDPTAEAIVRAAADELLATLERAEPPAGAPIVLAGGLLGSATPVHALVSTAVRQAWPDAEVRTGVDGSAAAAWLAALPLLTSATGAAALHARLVSGAIPGLAELQ